MLKGISIGILLGIIAIIIIGSTWTWVSNNHSYEHSQYCNKWLSHINASKTAVESQLFPNGQVVAQLNQDIDNYNKECYYPS